MEKLRLVFATNNQHKVDEIRSLLKGEIDVITLREAGIEIDIPEPHETLEENASEKSHAINKLTGLDCFSEDTGLEVNSLGGQPGVKSARYAGEHRSFDANIDKLLVNLQSKTDRSARFRTVISLLIHDKELLFEGICEGHILDHRKGTRGFGYDPVFIPNGSQKTFAEMTLEEKNYYSHRAKAVQKLVTFLTNMTVKK